MNWFLRILVGGTLWAAASANAQPTPYISAPDIVGSGTWRDSDQAQPTQRWSIDLAKADDGMLSGRVSLEDSPLMRSGSLRGRLDGKRLKGTIEDDHGLHVATFVGTITATGGFSGTYEDRTGATGRWEWEGPLPE